jgi:general stress protein YciG
MNARVCASQDKKAMYEAGRKGGLEREASATRLRSQFVTSRTARGQHGKYQPKAKSQVVANRDHLARAFVRL